MRNLRAERATDVAALADNARSIARAAEGREVYSMKVKGAWIYIEPSPEFVEEMSKYYRQG